MSIDEMLAFAGIECNLSVEQFFALSFYEWSIEVHRVKVRRKREHEIWEGNAALAGEVMALIANVNRDAKKKPVPFSRKDFIRLSFDPPEKQITTKPMTPLEMKQKFGTKFKKEK